MERRFVSHGNDVGIDTDTEVVALVVCEAAHTELQSSQLPDLMVTFGRDPGRPFRILGMW